MFEGYNVLDKGGGPAKKRFSDPLAVRAVYEKLSEDDLRDAKRRATIRQLYEGNVPYPPDMLARSGLRNLTNVNFLGMKGVIDNRADVILRLSSDTANLIELRPLARELAGPDAERIGAVAAEEWSAMVRAKGKFIQALAMMNREADLYGLGPVAWPNSVDYCPVALERGQIRFREDASAVSSDNDLYMFESTLSAEYLQYLVDNAEMAAEMGWDVGQVREWMRRVFRDGESTIANTAAPTSTSPLESAISMVRRNIVGEDRQFEVFHVIHVFVQEIAWPRGITHIVMPATADAKFLYYRPNAYRTMDECFMWFPYSTKERYAREVRGLASFLYPIEVLNNRFMCQMVDAAFRASSLVLSQQNQGVQSGKLTISEEGPYTVLPAGVTPAQSQVNPNFQQLIQVKQVLDQLGVASVAGVDKPLLAGAPAKLFSGGSGGSTKAEVEFQNQKASHRSEAEFSLRQDILNKIMRVSFMRSLSLAMMHPVMRVDYPEIDDWVRRCAMRGVTLEHLASIPQLFTVAVCRDLALGADGKVSELDNFVQLYGGTLDETGRKNLARDRARLRFGQKDADRYAPEASRDQAPSDQASLATVENGMMKMGMPVLVGQDQMHWSHIPVHSQVLQEIVEQVQAPEDGNPELDTFGNPEQSDESIGEQTLQNVGNDPKRTLALLVECSRHVQEHLEIGGQQIGMEGQAKQVEKMLRDLRPTTKALNLAVATQERVEQAQREQAERDQQKAIDQAAEEKARLAEIEADGKARADMYRADREHEVAMHRLELEGREADARSSRDDTALMADQARRERETDSRIDNERKMAESRINAANALNRFNAVNAATGMHTVSPGEIASGAPEEGTLNYASL